MKSIFLRGIRTRLTLWYMATLVLMLAAFAAQEYLLVKNTLTRALDSLTEQDISTVGLIMKSDIAALQALKQNKAIPYFAVYKGDKLIHQSDSWSEKGLLDAVEVAAHGREVFWTSPTGDSYRLKVRETTSDYRILVAREANDYYRALYALLFRTSVLCVSSLILAAAGGYWMASRTLRPVKAMAEKAREITVERLSDRLEIRNPHDEIGQLAAVFNATLSRLQDSFGQLQRFTADASHELRSPLAAMRSVGETALRTNEDAESLRDTIASMLEETGRLSGIVDNLLALTRGESGQIPVTPQSIAADTFLRESADTLLPLAEEKGIQFGLDVPAGLVMRADPVVLRHAVLNIMHNAINYTPENGLVFTRCGLNNGQVEITITDSGPGIEPADRERIFDRFYRGTTSSNTFGSGLGLAIAKWAAESLGGSLTLCEAAPGTGATFVIGVPVAQEA